MTKREKSRITFVCGVTTALVLTSIIVYMLVADLNSSQTLLLLLGCLLLLGAILFTFFEIYRLATESNRKSAPPFEDEDEDIDPDVARIVVLEPPTGEPYPHHEDHVGSPGLDQGQITSHLADEPPLNLRDVWTQWIARRRDNANRGKKRTGAAASH